MKEFFKKYQTQIVGVAILAVASVIVYAAVKETQPPFGNTPNEAVRQSSEPPAPPVLKPAPTSAPAKQITTLQIIGKPQPGKSYQAVVEAYKDRRIQFDDTCRATPHYLTFKNGPEIMFDNRSIEEKIIKLNDIGYKIGPYGFIVLEITAPSPPYQVDIDCNQLFNAAIINLQK